MHREQRICNLCCTNLVEDDLHYLFVCHEFSLRQRRQIFINDVLKVNDCSIFRPDCFIHQGHYGKPLVSAI